MIPTVVTLCGSTRFKAAFEQANLQETLAGKIVLSIGCASRSDAELFGNLTEQEWKETKIRLDKLHFAKIDMSDEVLILNVSDYIGESTGRELAYSRQSGKRVRWLEKSKHAQEGETFG